MVAGSHPQENHMQSHTDLAPRVALKLTEDDVLPEALEVLAKYDHVDLELPIEEEEGSRRGCYVAYRKGHFQVRVRDGSLMDVGLDQLLSYAAREGSMPRLINNLARVLNKRLPEDQRVKSF